MVVYSGYWLLAMRKEPVQEGAQCGAVGGDLRRALLLEFEVHEHRGSFGHASFVVKHLHHRSFVAFASIREACVTPKSLVRLKPVDYDSLARVPSFLGKIFAA